MQISYALRAEMDDLRVANFAQGENRKVVLLSTQKTGSSLEIVF